MPLHGLMSTRESTTSECCWPTPTPHPHFTKHRTEPRPPGLAFLNSTPDSNISITRMARGVERFEAEERGHGKGSRQPVPPPPQPAGPPPPRASIPPPRLGPRPAAAKPAGQACPGRRNSWVAPGGVEPDGQLRRASSTGLALLIS